METEKPSGKPKMHLPGIAEAVIDKGYHSGETLVMLKNAEVRTCIPEKKQKGQRHWDGKGEQQQAVYANRLRRRRNLWKTSATEARRADRAKLCTLL
jgi:hypothetical protein